MGGRLDTLQAAILDVKLSCYDEDIVRRQNVALAYTQKLKSSPIRTPIVKEDRTSVWAQYSVRIQNRDNIQSKLKDIGVPTAVHYPKPLHLQECFEYLGYKKGDFPISELVSDEIMSLPMNPYLTEEEINYITSNLLNLI